MSEKPLTTKQLAFRIKTMRKHAMRTQAECAKAVGIPRPQFTLVEQGKRKISILELDKLSRYLAMDISGWFDKFRWQ